MKATKLNLVTLLLVILATNLSVAQDAKTTTNFNFSMNSKKKIIDNLTSSNGLTIFNDLLNAADFSSSLSSTKAFTVFAPCDDALNKIPVKNFADLMSLENFDQLRNFVGGFIFKGKVSFLEISKNIKTGNGDYSMKTVSGNSVIFTIKDKHLVLTDSNGNVSNVLINDINQSNGTIFIIDKIIFPNTSSDMFKTIAKK